MKKEKGEGKRPPVPRYIPMNRTYSATGFSPQGHKPPHTKCPPLRGATGGKHGRKPPKLLIGRHDFAPLTLNPYTLNPFSVHRATKETPKTPFNDSTNQPFNFPRPLIHTERDEKGKMKNEKGEGKRPPVPRYIPMNRTYSATGFSPQGRKPPNAKSPLLRGATGGVKQCRELPKLLIGRHDFAPLTLNPYTLNL